MRRILVPTLLIGILLLSACGAPPAPPTETLPASPSAEQQTCTLNIRVSPPGAGFVSCPGNEYEPGVQVMLTATPASGYTFDYWHGHASGSSTTTTIVMNSDKSIIAYFVELPVVFSWVEVYDILESTATIQWHTKEPATFQVEYGTSNAYGSATSDTVWKDATDWGRVVLRELNPGTTYHFRICGVDKDGNQAFSDDYTFTTLTPKGVFSARLFPFIGAYGDTPPRYIMRLNTSLFNGSSQAITVTKIEFLYEDGGIYFTLPTFATNENDYEYLTEGRSDLPEIWKNKRLDAGRLLFTGVEFWIQPTAREVEGWQVKWYCLDVDGVEFTVKGKYSSLP